MLFNSLNFALFFPVIFLLYWFATKGKLKPQNILLLAASYFFYACWDWRFLSLLLFSTLLDYCTGLQMNITKNKARKKFWLWLSICVNLGFLGVFKYFNFFAESFADALSNFGLQVNPWSLQVILPVGISFYTFHGLSYIIDVYNNKVGPERNLIDYALFVSFFPLLVAGPIERAAHLLPQIKKERKFDYAKAVDGLRQILWGLFKKIVIADNCAEYANAIFNHPENFSGSTLVLGAVFFSIQIYGDFSGYSDIALGTARLLGIDLFQNFAFPYFSRSIAEFWRRWHISLSSWFKDYVYVPLGGSRGGNFKKIINIFIIFLVSGFWHGANWTFIAWGFLHALYIMPAVLFSTNRNNLNTVAAGRLFPTMKELLQMAITFSLVVFAWIFFRSSDLPRAFDFISAIFSRSLFQMPDIQLIDSLQIQPYMLLAFLILFLLIEWSGRSQQYALAGFALKWPKPLRLVFYYCIAMIIFLFAGKEQQFIYFQF
jgi:D-alanyl-lipoteichoic acid acyltransferase DltB (MBOAT superfamily)